MRKYLKNLFLNFSIISFALFLPFLIPGELLAQIIIEMEMEVEHEVVLPPPKVTATRSEKNILDVPVAIRSIDLSKDEIGRDAGL